jgi:hypothetical protein
VASFVAVVAIAGGGYAALQFFAGGGPRPAEVLPASTFALVTLDLNPSGGQKIEAIKTLRKFPGFRDQVGLKPESDVIKAIFDEVLQDSCRSLDYERDVKPWIGDRAGVGGVLLSEDEPAPVLALQVTDAAKAKPGFTALAECTGANDDEDFGWTVTDDYVVVSDSTRHAEAIVAAAVKAPLSENGNFQKWTEQVGGPAIMNAYVGPEVRDVLSDQLGSSLEDMSEAFPGTASGRAGADPTDALKDFKGAAAGLKFEDGGIELAFAGGGLAPGGEDTVAAHVGDLPKDTAAVVAVAVPPDALERLGSDRSSEKGWTFLENFLMPGSGLALPEDLLTLLGSSLSLSVGADAPSDLARVAGLGDLPLGLLVHGDDVKIKEVIAKVEAMTGTRLSDLPATVASEDGKVAAASTSGYAQDLLADGSLADAESYQDVVSHADDAQAVAYVSFENQWLEALRDLAADERDKEFDEVVENLAVLRAVGASAWSEGDTSHGQIRVALK